MTSVVVVAYNAILYTNPCMCDAACVGDYSSRDTAAF